MLSILIPVYNYDVIPLALELNKQCLESKIDFEILCQDDQSNSDLNTKNEIIQKLQGEYDELVSIGNNTEDLREI